MSQANGTAVLSSDRPRIYVASLSDYNAGRLHGRWIDADQSAEGIAKEVELMLSTSAEPGAEEYAIHDHDGFYGLSIGEYESLERVAEIASLIAEHGPAFAAYVTNEGAEYATAEGFEDAYAGEWGDVDEYASELIDEGALGEIPESLAPYIDVERFARDLVLGGDIWTADAPGGRCWVFRSC